MTSSNEDFKHLDLDTLSKIWEPRKEYIEKDLWVIRNFLSTQELEWLNTPIKIEPRSYSLVFIMKL